MVKNSGDYTYNLADDREDYDVEEDVEFNVEDEYVNFAEDEQIDEPNDNQGNDGNDGDQANEANDEIRDREIIMDYTNLFSTMEHFASRDALIKWVRAVGKENNIVVVVTRSNAGLGRKKAYVMLACERGGVYRQFKRKVKDTVERNEKKKAKKEENVDFNVEEEESIKGRITGSKKCGCPFMLKGRQICPSEWSLEVKCGTHNHPIATHLEGHSFEGRLNDEEEELVIDLSKCNAPPNDVLIELKRKHEHNHSTIRTIYNARKKHRVIQACGHTQLQYLMRQLVEKKYFQYTRRCEKTSVIKELFFAHPVSIQLVHAFPKVLLIDCTYKTNRYKLPLLEIVRVTSTGMTFSIASVFLIAEKEENYAWALGVLRSLLGKNSLPTVIVTDREIALINALASIFPETRHFLCTWHIDRNVLAKCKKKFTNDNQWNEFNAQFNNLWKSDSEQDFEDALRKLQLNFACNEKKPVDYVMKAWINPYKEKFVRAWTNEFMHYGNTTSNRVESHHSALKKMLGNSMGNFQTCFTKCDTLFEACHIAIKASFEKSVNVAQHKFSSNIYSHLRGMVSQVALDKLFDEAKEVRQPFFDVKNCKHILRKVYGLPCAHEIEEYVYADKPIPVNALDSFWRKLDFQPIKEDVNTYLDKRFDEVVNDMGEVYKNFSPEEKMIFLRKIRELTNPATTNLVEPLPKVDTRGRPVKGKGKAKTTKASDYSTKRDPSLFEHAQSLVGSCTIDEPFHVYDVSDTQPSPMFSKKGKPQKPPIFRRRTLSVVSSNYIDSIPTLYHPYIVDIVDVRPDGHCGFRAVAALKNFREDNWDRVRRDLTIELSKNISLYTSVFWGENKVNEIMSALNCFTPSAGRDHWFQLPDMAYLVASAYNIAFITLSPQISVTTLPFNVAVPENPRFICMALVNNDHFVQVYFGAGHPMPPVVERWKEKKQPISDGWHIAYKAEQITQLERKMTN